MSQRRQQRQKRVRRRSRRSLRIKRRIKKRRRKRRKTGEKGRTRAKEFKIFHRRRKEQSGKIRKTKIALLSELGYVWALIQLPYRVLILEYIISLIADLPLATKDIVHSHFVFT